MKRSLKYISLLVAFVLIATGCGKKDAKTLFIDALNKTDAVNSINTKATADISMKDPDSGSNLNATATADFDLKSQDENSVQVHGNLTASSSGVSYTTEGYFDISKEKVGAYFNFLGQWFKFENEIDQEEMKKAMEEYEKVSSNYSINDVANYIKSAKEEESDKKGYTKLNIVFDKTKLNEELTKAYNDSKDEIAKETSNDAELNDAMNEAKEYLDKGIFSEDIELVVYVKDGYISIVEIDLSKLMNSVFNSLLTQDELKEYNEFALNAKLTYEFSKFNSIDKIEVPEVAKNGTDIMQYLQDSSKDLMTSQEV